MRKERAATPDRSTQRPSNSDLDRGEERNPHSRTARRPEPCSETPARPAFDPGPAIRKRQIPPLAGAPPASIGTGHFGVRMDFHYSSLLVVYWQIMKDEEFGLRDLAKSMMSCAWAISVFGMRQMTSLLTAPGAGAKELAQAVDKVTDAATATFDDSAQTIYRAGTSIQNAMIDVTLGGAIFDARKPSQGEPPPA